MNSRTSYSNLLAWVFEQKEFHRSHQSYFPPNATCIARWEDDGGRTLKAARQVDTPHPLTAEPASRARQSHAPSSGVQK